jgi:AcrR family transcriptional regulator
VAGSTARATRARRRPAAWGTAEGTAPERILAAALREFADRGFEGASLRAIAGAAGVTQPLVHYHFDSKDALWKAAVARGFAEIADRMDGLRSELRDLDPASRLRVTLRRFVTLAAARPELGRVIAREGARRSRRLTWLVERHIRPFFEATWADLRAESGRGRIKPLPPEHLMFIFNAAATYLFNVPALARELFDIDVRSPATIEMHADTLVELFFDGVLRAAGSERRKGGA